MIFIYTLIVASQSIELQKSQLKLKELNYLRRQGLLLPEEKSHLDMLEILRSYEHPDLIHYTRHVYYKVDDRLEHESTKLAPSLSTPNAGKPHMTATIWRILKDLHQSNQMEPFQETIFEAILADFQHQSPHRAKIKIYALARTFDRGTFQGIPLMLEYRPFTTDKHTKKLLMRLFKSELHIRFRQPNDADYLALHDKKILCPLIFGKSWFCDPPLPNYKQASLSNKIKLLNDYYDNSQSGCLNCFN